MNVCDKCGCDIWPGTGPTSGCSCPGGSPNAVVVALQKEPQDCVECLRDALSSALARSAAEKAVIAAALNPKLHRCCDAEKALGAAVDALLRENPAWGEEVKRAP